VLTCWEAALLTFLGAVFFVPEFGIPETCQAIRKLLYLANVNILKKWTRPMADCPLILNQLAIRFEDRFPS
jgi:transposase-like protein